LGLMKKEACLVNISRGDIVDEEALYRFLKDGRIRAAALDVFSQEPPEGSPLLTLDNLIATPHMGGYTFEALRQKISEHLTDYHSTNPLKTGMPKEELKSKFPLLTDAKLFNQVLNQMIKSQQIVQEENTVRLDSHRVSLGRDQADIRNKILEIYGDGGLQPPYFRDVIKELNTTPKHVQDVLMLLVEEGLVIKTKDDLYFDVAAVENLKARLVEFLKSNGEITTPQFKEMTGVSRKYVIPLIEYFDAKNVTLRVGDSRKLRKG